MRARVGLGLLSGTSLDAIDAAVCRFEGGGAAPRVTLLRFSSHPWPRPLRERLRAAAEGRAATREICRLHADAGVAFAAAAAEAVRRSPQPVEFVGSHGQTLWHEPGTRGRPTATFQAGDAAFLAERLRLPIVADFRPSDCAAGGEGAPLVPYPDWVLFRRPRRTVVVQNLGGIGNCTVVTPEFGDVFAFDTGPANLPIDEAVRLATRGRETLDRGGRRAARGRVDAALVRRLLRHPFLRRRPPRTTGREAFGARFVAGVAALPGAPRGDDLVATLTRFVAEATADAYRHWVFPRAAPDEIRLAGGGARNPTLVGHLRALLAPVPVDALDAAGFPGAAREAAAFAVLADAAFRGVPSNCPAATGARRRVVLGKVLGVPPRP